MKNSLVVDSSVAVKWYLPENGSERASSLLEAGIRLVAPDLLIPEVGNVLWKRRREMPVEEMEAMAIALTTACPVSLYSSSALFMIRCTSRWL